MDIGLILVLSQGVCENSPLVEDHEVLGSTKDRLTFGHCC